MEEHNTEPLDPQEQPQQNRADDSGRIYVDAFLRVWDPNSQETLLETRA